MKVLLLNSRGFSEIGWVASPATQRTLAESLQRSGVQISIEEAADAADVGRILRDVERGTLVWPNAYYVRSDSGADGTLWMGDIIESRGVPFIGSPAATLRTVLHKDICQSRLASAGIPIPRFARVTQRDLDHIRGAVEESDLSWPMVVKPTSMADSIGVLRVNNLDELGAQVGHILDNHGPVAIIETYLPSPDITIGVFLQGHQTTLITSWYEMNDREGVLDHHTRLIPWGGPKQMRLVEDLGILDQVQSIAPRAARALGVRDFTRIDGRLDHQGRLRIFDVNGMPSLDYPDTVTLRQVMMGWEDMDALSALDQLIASIVRSAAERYHLPIPDTLAARTLPITGPRVHARTIEGTAADVVST